MTPRQADQLLRAAHARSIKSIAYGLGKGGRDPEAAGPADKNGRLDCSGLTCWIDRIDRLQMSLAARNQKPDRYCDIDNDGDLDPVIDEWFGTGGIIADATSDRSFYEEIDRPELGALLVYAADKKAGRPYGHVGMVTGGLPAEWDPKVPACWKALEVTDCHGPNGRRPGVMLVSGAGWGRHWGQRNGTIIVRRVG